MQKLLLSLLLTLFLSITLSCAAVIPYAVGFGVGVVAIESVDLLSDDDSPTTVTVEEGGAVTVVNEAEVLPDSAISLVAFLISHIWETLAAVVVLWLLPSPAQMAKHFKAWRTKAKEFKDAL